ncbi:MAG: DUF1847 domain-containing protein [Polyangiaceae bacterium]|nr:DUF1847 domain-containing protein [Polyangiaceae bacterium]
MRVAVPVFGSRVAPNFMHSRQWVLGRLDQERVVEVAKLDVADLDDPCRIQLLQEREISVLVCGGIDHELLTELRCRGIDVVHNVAGEMDDVLAQFARGRLRAGYGITYRPDSRTQTPDELDKNGFESPEGSPAALSTPDEAQLIIDCIACGRRTCLQGAGCRAGGHPPKAEPITAQLHQLMSAALDISAEPERVLCRIAELTYFCVEMQYQHVGLAFCADLFAESETVTRLLRRFVRVTPVCCRVGGPWAGPEEQTPATTCNPFAMAHALNEAHTDLNVAVGLSIGCDVVFDRLSHAPVTTLFVKDKLLANNPVSACHSRYVLERILAAP